MLFVFGQRNPGLFRRRVLNSHTPYRKNYIQKYSEKQVYLLTKVSLYLYIEVHYNYIEVHVEPDNPVTPNAIAL